MEHEPKKRGRKSNIEVSALDVVKAASSEKILLYMQYGAGYSTGSGVDFTDTHPYQLVAGQEAFDLLVNTGGRFRAAAPEELKLYYQIEG